MRNTSTIFSLIIGITIIGGATSAGAQGRRQHQDHDRNRDQSAYRESRDDDERREHRDGDHRDHYSHKDRRDHGDRHRHRHYNDHYRREVRHIHYHDRYCGHRPVVHHHHKKPRYIYFRDYDVYYDSHRSVYISYTGRSWTISRAIPADMRYVNVRTTRSYEVDYYDDDFPSYLERRRPSCGQEYRGW